MKLSFAVVFLTLLSLDAFGQVPWIETKFPGAAPIKGPITQIEADQNGAIYGVVREVPARIARSTNRGESWIYHSLPFDSVRSIERFGDRFYLSTKTDVRYSDDLENWNIVSGVGGTINANKGVLIAQSGSSVSYMPAPNGEFLRLPDSVTFGGCAIAPQGKSYVFCLSKSGLWISPFGIALWTKLSDGYPDSILLRDITIVRDSLFVAAEHKANGRPILFSSGLTSLRLTEMMIEGGLLFRELFTFRDSVLVAVRQDRTAPIHDINYSIDLQLLSPAFSRPSMTINDLSVQGDRMWFVSNDGIWWNDDIFRTWEKASRRLEPNVITQLQSIPPKTLLAITTRGNLMVTNDGGETWEDRYSFDKPVTMTGYSPRGTLFIGQQGELLVSSDQGRNFIQTSGFSDRTLQAFAVGNEEKLFLGSDSGLFFSTNDGQTWFRPKSFLMNIMTGAPQLPEVLSIAIEHRTNAMYVGTSNGVIFSLNEGEKYESGWLRKTPVYALAVNKRGEAFAGSYSISSSDPNLRNFYRGWDVLWQNPAWIGTDTTIEDYDMHHIMLNSRDQIISGMLFSNTSGNTWEFGQIEGKGSSTRFSTQAIDADDIAYVAIDERLYRSAGPKLETPYRKSEAVRLELYPNPASDELRLKSGERGEVTLFNALGEVVLNASIEPGSSIDIRRLPAGNYFCQLRSNSGLHRSPLTIVR